MVYTSKEDRPGWAPWIPRVGVPAWLGGELTYGGLRVMGMALGQIPLTTLNSVIAVSALAGDLMPDFPVGVTRLGFSVAAMNLVGCWFGAMPVCHGAGGLAAQWRFGARSGASVMVLGLMKLVLGLVFGDSLMGVVGRFPGPVLGVMVLGAGLELARVAVGVNEDAMDLYEDHGEVNGDGVVVLRRKKRVLDDEERTERWMVMLVTVAGIISFRNDAVGFAGGMLCYWFYRLAAWWERRRGQGELRL
jgi:membrane associated rhomboid family serine protease